MNVNPIEESSRHKLLVEVSNANEVARKKDLRAFPFVLPRGTVVGMACNNGAIVFVCTNGSGGFYNEQQTLDCVSLEKIQHNYANPIKKRFSIFRVLANLLK